MKTIQVNITEEIQNQILRYTQDQQFFVFNAIVEKLSTLKEKGINELLIEGYKSSALENEMIMDDFQHIDLENWDVY